MLFHRRLLTTDISDYSDDLRLRLAHRATLETTVYMSVSRTIFNKLPFNYQHFLYTFTAMPTSGVPILKF